MHNYRQVTEDIYNLGANDRRITMFENSHPVPRGMSYNSYLIMDEKTVLMDAVDRAVADQFWENLQAALGGRPLDYLVVQHMEPDHCSQIPNLIQKYPDMKVVGNKKTFQMINQFYDVDLEGHMLEVKEGDVLEFGKRKLTFYMAPMVHWPEVMMSYDSHSKIFFSADAFGTFGPIDGRQFADQYGFEDEYLPEARRYYTSIVGKYGRNVLSLFDKISGLDIQMICTLHGPIWRKDLGKILEKYQKWASYTPEERGVVIAFGSVYGNTALAAEILANKLAEAGEEKIVVHDVSSADPSEILADCFKYDRMIFASSTFNAELFPHMESALLDLKAHNLTNRTIALVENGSWALSAGKKMREIFESMKGITILDESHSIKSAVKDGDLESLDAIVKAILAA